MDIIPTSNYPSPSLSSLQLQYVGKRLEDLPTPAAVIDRAVVRRNCDAMLSVCKQLGVNFRAHTLELSRLQVGTEGPADFVVSTLIEAENLVPFIRECQAKGRPSSIIYGVPIAPSAVPRLLHLASKLEPGSVNMLIDNWYAHLEFQEQAASAQIGIYIKIDTGYHRAGIQTTSPKFPRLLEAVVSIAGEKFRGFYSHYGHSYGGGSEDDAVNGLIEELTGLEKAAAAVPDEFRGRLVLTVGATPTATAAQNMLSSSPRAGEFRKLLGRLQEKYMVEFHAGVYPLLDLQQVATHARPPTGQAPLSKDSIGMKMLLEVSSVYEEREKPEALVSAGSLALGREPCKSYAGWGIVTGEMGNNGNQVYDERGDRTGWIVGRISQEHGILTWEGSREHMQPLVVGERVLVWPNHACVAGAGFGWYVVVDSGMMESDRVVDVWTRWRGW